MTKFVHVEPISSARAQLSETIARIGEQGLHAEPVVIGRRYKPEAVLISFELYERLADLIDEIQLAPSSGNDSPTRRPAPISHWRKSPTLSE